MDLLARLHLNGLRAVEAAGRFGTLSRAAEHLGVTPGAVSQHILRTERQLGRVLFERTPKGLVATAFGDAFLAELSQGFRHLAAAAALAQDRAQDSLVVTVPPNFASYWLVPRLHGFTAPRPDLKLHIDARSALVNIAENEADIGIRVGDGRWPGLRVERLLDIMVMPVCSPALATSLRQPRDLAGVPMLHDSNAYHSWETWLDKMGLDRSILRPGPVFSDSALCLEAAAAGQGVMLSWQPLAADAIAAGRVVAPFPTLASSGRAYWFVWVSTRPLRPIEAAFRSWLTGTLDPLRRQTFEAMLERRIAEVRGPC